MTSPLRASGTGEAAPQRIQLRRTKGWRKPPDAITVARPSMWGNPWHVIPAGPGGWTVVGPPFAASGMIVTKPTATNIAVEAFRRALRDGELDITEGHVRDVLRGRDLACWCKPGPCHADVLLEIANRPAP